MGGFAARKAVEVVEHVETVIAIEMLAACQVSTHLESHFRSHFISRRASVHAFGEFFRIHGESFDRRRSTSTVRSRRRRLSRRCMPSCASAWRRGTKIGRWRRTSPPRSS